MASKLKPPGYYITASCKEIFHPHSHHCGPNFTSLFRKVFWQGIKLYVPFFLFVKILSGKNIASLSTLKSFTKSVTRGSLFLGAQTNRRSKFILSMTTCLALTDLISERILTLFFRASYIAITGPGSILLCCSSRNLLGFHSRIAISLSCLVAAFIAINVEDDTRARELTVYTASVTAESVFRLLVSRGIVKPINHGKTLIFIASMALSSYLKANNRCSRGTHYQTMTFISGDRNGQQQIISESADKRILKALGLPQDLLKSPKHKDFIYVVSGFARGFASGLGLRLLSMILSGKISVKSFLSKLEFATFLSLLLGLFRLGKVLTSSADAPQSTFSSLFSGALSGCASFLSPSTELSLFAAAKSIDAVLRTRNYNPNLPQAHHNPPTGHGHAHHRKEDINSVRLTFAACCAFLYYCMIFETHNLRPSYVKFLITLSAGTLRNNVKLSPAFQRDLGIKNLTPPGAFD